MQYYIIGDEDTVLGFGMVGVKGKAVTNENEAAAAFDEAISNSDIGIIIITEKTAKTIRTRVNKYLFTQEFPLIIEIPDRNGKDPNSPGLREMVNRAVGIQL